MISAAAAVNPGFPRFAGGSGTLDSLFDRLTAGRSPQQTVAAEPEQRGPDLRERGYAVLRRSLEEQLSLRPAPGSSAQVATSNEPDSAGSISNRVLGFIASRLQREAESGASPDRLRDLLSQARSGFDKGLTQAADELGSLGLLNDDTGAGIDQVRNLVEQGLDRLQEQFLSGQFDVAQPATSSLAEATRSMRLANSEALSLEVRTRDGDTVRLSFRASSGYSESSYSGVSDGPEGRVSATSFQQSAFYSSRYSVSVKGELDEGEQRALQDLLGRVENLADEFFDGDAQLAFQQALELGFDREQIATFSLRLTETSVQQVTETYRAVQQFGPEQAATSEPASNLRNLGQFLKTMREAVESAQAFADGEGMVADLFRMARQLDPRDLAAGDDATLEARQSLLELLSERYGQDFSDAPRETEADVAQQVLPEAA